MGFVERKRWLFLGLPWTFTKYTVEDNVLTTDKGLINTVENDCYMYKIQDVQLETSFMERIFKLGTVVCYTGDVTDKKLELKHIRNAKEIKNFILEKSEEDRRKRRTLNTLDIGADSEADLADID